MQLSGNISPIPGLTIKNAGFSAERGVGLKFSGGGKVIGIPFAVAATLSTRGGFAISLVAKKIGIGSVMTALIPGLIPDFVIPALDIFQISTFALGFNSSQKIKFAMRASVDAESIPGLSEVTQAMQISDMSVYVSIGPNDRNQLSLIVGAKTTFTFKVPPPFTQDGQNMTIGLKFDLIKQMFAITVAMGVGIDIPIFTEPQRFYVELTVALSARSGTIQAEIAGARTSIMRLKAFPWVYFGAFNVSAAIMWVLIRLDVGVDTWLNTFMNWWMSDDQSCMRQWCMGRPTTCV